MVDDKLPPRVVVPFVLQLARECGELQLPGPRHARTAFFIALPINAIATISQVTSCDIFDWNVILDTRILALQI